MSSTVRTRLQLSLLVLLAACAGGPARQAAVPEILPARIAAHVDILAGDAFEGRAPGTPGETKTVAYITDAFQSAGLMPVGAAFSLPVPLLRSVAVAGSIGAGGVSIENGAEGVVRAPEADGAVAVEAEAVFAGYGVRAAGEGRDDYAKLDVEGKVVVMLAGLGSIADSAPEAVREQAGRAAKLKTAGDLGARAGIVVYGDNDPTWTVVRGSVERELMRLDGESAGADASTITAVVSGEAGTRLMAALGADLAALRREAESPGFSGRPIGKVRIAATNRLQRFASANVAGMVRGSARPDEHIVYLAHWDHLGRCAATGDTICNGAVDNASGIGGLIELARAFAGGEPPERSVVFLATTAEESGLLGGRHFVRSGPVAASRMVAAFGLDTIAASGPTRDVIVLGHGQSSFDDWIAAAARASGRRIVEMPGVQSFFTRSDHYAFAEAGVPAVIATGMFAAGGAFRNYMRDHYHKPSDEPSAEIDYRGAAADVALILEAGRRLANSREWPVWAKSSPYQRGVASQP